MRLSGLALIGLLFAGVLLGGCERQALDVPKYPTKPAIGLELQAEERGGEIRYIERDKDQNPISGRIEYPNGDTAYVTYYPNGQVKETTEYYPEVDGQERVKRFWATFTDKGKYLKDELYREDGTLVRQGHRQGTKGTIYDVAWMFPDGKTTMRHKLISDLTEPFVDQLDEKFRMNGSWEFVMKLLPDGKTFTTFYTDANVRQYTWLRSKTPGVNQTYEEFFADGKTTAMKVEYGPQFTASEYYRQDGTMEQARMKTIFGELDVFNFDAAGKIAYRQKWRHNTSGTLLRRLQVYAPGEVVVKMIELGQDGKTPLEIQAANKPGDKYGSTKTFRRGGTLEKEVVRDSSGNISASHWYAESENIRESLPADWVAMRPFKEPPELPKN